MAWSTKAIQRMSRRSQGDSRTSSSITGESPSRSTSGSSEPGGEDSDLTPHFQMTIAWSDDVPALTDPGLQRSFCELGIALGAEQISKHVNRATVHETLFVPAAPVAAWFAANWAALLSGEVPRLLRAASDPRKALATVSDEAWEKNELEIEPWLRSHSLEEG